MINIETVPIRRHYHTWYTRDRGEDRVACDEADATHVRYECGHTRVEFDLGLKDTMEGRARRYYSEQFEKFVAKIYERGITEGKRQTRDAFRQVTGI